MDEHHDGTDCAAGFKEQDPATVEEEEDGETELDTVAHSLDVVNGVVQGLPGSLLQKNDKFLFQLRYCFLICLLLLANFRRLIIGNSIFLLTW